MNTTLPDDLEYIIKAYGHLIPLHKEITFKEFSELIKTNYDPELPRNEWAIRITSKQKDISVQHLPTKMIINLTK